MLWNVWLNLYLFVSRVWKQDGYDEEFLTLETDLMYILGNSVTTGTIYVDPSLFLRIFSLYTERLMLELL